MPVVVAVVLEGLPGIVGFSCVVGASVVAGGLAGEWGVCGEDGGALREVEIDVAFEVDGEAEPCARGEEDCAAACGCCGFDGFVDGGSIDGFAIAYCAEGAEVEDVWGGVWRLCGGVRGGYCCGGYGGQAQATALQ